MKIGLAQINPCVGDLEGNVRRCLAAIGVARRQGAELVVLPEMAVPGYPPRDILLDGSFVEAVGEATADLAARAGSGAPAIVGSLEPSGRQLPSHPGLYNTAVLLAGGRAQTVARKRLLPGYDVFYEPRWFVPGPAMPPIELAGRRLGVLVCEDMWVKGYDADPPAELLAAGAEILVCLAAPPYRRRRATPPPDVARRAHAPFVYVAICGGQDELIFDGHSFALNRQGELLAELDSFKPDVRVVDMDHDPPRPPAPVHPEEELFNALVLGVRDFCRKNRLKQAFLGLSGGVDSAVVAVIAAAALGPGRVTAIANPSRYTDPRSTACAAELAGALGIGFRVVELEPLHAAAEAALGPLLEGGTTAENVQARLRAMIWMSFVNRYGGMLLNCSNKTELALGYATLYGDMAGTLSPIGDLTKPEVVALARWIKDTRGLIPDWTLERPPSAELRPGQVDPFDYDVIAPRMEKLVLANQSDAALRHSEHKRWQMGVVLKVSEKSFGTGRLMPITRR